jgi:DNA polymerase III alpha subunit
VIHGLDEAAWEAILEDRRRRGPFADFHDFRRRVPLGSETLALLILAGAFDFTGCSRPELLLDAEMVGRTLTSCPPRQPELFASPAAGNTPQAAWSPSDYSQARRWKEEWERLGFLVGPPLMSLFRPYLPQGLPASRDLHMLIGKRVCVAGLVATARHAATKHGETMAFMSLQDEWGFIDVTFFPGTFPTATYLGMGPYLVWGTVEEQYDVVTVTAERFRKQDVAPWSGS